MHDLHDFLDPVSPAEQSGDEGYNDGQLAKHLLIHEDQLPDISDADIILLGIKESRGNGFTEAGVDGPDRIRKQLYRLNFWHKNLVIADLGNVKQGSGIADSYAAIRTVLSELIRLNKKVVLLGGSHDITLAQYFAYCDAAMTIEATCIDACIDLKGESHKRSENFLMEMLTGEPNQVKHYNHIGFQSYLVHPRMLETMDKLRFDCFRLGVVKENMEEMEPVLRNTHLLSFDMDAVKYGDSPASRLSPNGFTGEEACLLTRYAGMSTKLSSMGIYGYRPELDEHGLTAKQIAQMTWYFIDGVSRGKEEATLEKRDQFNEFHCTLTELDTLFLQSRRTGRWWMQLPDRRFIACSYGDYLLASRNEIPERWLRSQERG